MNRREFLKSSVASAAYAVLPPVSSGAQPAHRGVYAALAHPDFAADFVSISARGRWKQAFRIYRTSTTLPRLDGAREIVEAFMHKGFGMPTNAEVGRIESVRFIKSLR